MKQVTALMLTLLSIVCHCFPVKAQTPSLVWLRGIGGIDADYVYGITTDSARNVYIAGSFKGTVDLDPGPAILNMTATGEEDVFILKLNNSGSLVWAKSFGGSYTDHAFSVAVDNRGNVVTTGYYSGTVDFDPGVSTFNLTSGPGYNMFVQKLDSSGNLLWAKTIVGSSGGSGPIAEKIVIDGNRDIYLAGDFGGNADFDPGVGVTNLTTFGEDDLFILKLDGSGNFVWVRRMGGVNSDGANSMSLDKQGRIYVTGHFSGTADFDPGPGVTQLTAAGNYDVFAVKLDSAGNLIWAKGIGGSAADDGKDIRVDNRGNVYLTGVFKQSADFDPGAGTTILTSAGDNDIFVLKLDSLGKYLWARSWGSATIDFVDNIAVDTAGSLYTGGSCFGPADLDPGPGAANYGSSSFVQKLDSSGNFVWVLGDSSNIVGSLVTLDNKGDLYTAGIFGKSTDDLNPARALLP